MVHLEFHCHTIYSSDSLLTPARLLAACQRKGIIRVVITDHNTLTGALEAQQLDPQRVILGEEIMTQRGELLAAFVKEEVPPGLTPSETIERLRLQGAFISVSHPFDAFRKGHWDLPDLVEILPAIDAIEIFNSRCLKPEFNKDAQDFARQHGLAGTAGSDAHTAAELGRAMMVLPDFQTPSELKSAILQAEYRMKLSSPWIHFTSRYAVWRKGVSRIGDPAQAK